MRFIIGFLTIATLAACAGSQTHVLHADKARATSAKRIAVIYLTRGKVVYGDLGPQSEESAKQWEIDQAIERAARESLDSAGKQMTAFQAKEQDKFKAQDLEFVTAIDAVVFIGERNIRMGSGKYYSGVGVMTDRKRLFQTVIEPFAMLAVAAKTSGSKAISEAYNSEFVGGGLSASSAPLMENMRYQDSLAAYSPDERRRLKEALHERIRVVVRALFSDLGYAKPN